MTHLDPNTRTKYQAILRKFDVHNDTTWADVRPTLESISNQNTRRSCIVVLRIFLGKQGAPKIPPTVRRVYDLPDETDIAKASEGPYQAMILAMAYAGLRIGEACALRPTDVHKAGKVCWIDVNRSKDYSRRIKQPKTGSGRVVIPEWLFDILKASDYPDILPNSLYKYMKRRGLQPHGLRHWYATYLVRTVANVELARKQLRHANLQTTLQTYVEITSQDEMTVIQGLANPFAA